MGISVYHNGIKINTFSWSKITKIAFKRKGFFIQLRRELSEEYDTLLMFDCWSYRSCKKLWKSCVEHHAFFRLSAPPPPNRRPALLFLALGSRFRYSGRTEYQTREDASSRSQSRERERERRTFFRSPSKKLNFLRQTLGGNNRSRENSRGRSKEREKDRSCVELRDRGETNKENIEVVNSNNSGSQYYSNSQSSTVQLHAPSSVIINSAGVSANGMIRDANGIIRDANGIIREPNGIIRDSLYEVIQAPASAGRHAVAGVKTSNIRAYDKVHQSGCDKEPRQAWAEQDLSDDSCFWLTE
ncbi:unnamed protein product, partial [Allacma fusca]